MLVDTPTHSITASLEKQKLHESPVDAIESSLDNHVDSISRPNKRPKDDQSEMDYNLTSNTNLKRRKSPPLSDDQSQIPQAHETSRAETLEPEGWNTLRDTGLEDQDQPPVELLKDLETRPITVAQLIQEVKGIYAGLGMQLKVIHLIVLTNLSHGREEVH